MDLEKNYFEICLECSTNRVNSRTLEAKIVKNYIYKLVKHFYDIKNINPGITKEEFEKKISDEIDNYAFTTFENGNVFSGYMQYICCRYLQEHPKKYKEISELIKSSDKNFKDMIYENCSTFDEYLSLYTYTIKKDLCMQIFGKDLANDDNIKNLDDILDKDKKIVAKYFFGTYFKLPQVADVLTDTNMSQQKKSAKLRELSNLYKLTTDRKRFLDFANIFLNGSYSYLPDHLAYTEKELKRQLAVSTELFVSASDSLGNLEDYISDYATKMYESGFPEFASLVCTNGNPTPQFVKNLDGIESCYIKKRFNNIVSPEKVKSYLSENYLRSSKNLSMENLLALNSFWANRYLKQLEFYSEAMFTIYDLDLVSQIFENDKIHISISEKEIQQMLIKMGTFYNSASEFVKFKQIADNESHNADAQGDFNTVTGAKIFRYSYSPYVEEIKNKFGKEYHSYFSEVLPHSTNDIEKESELCVRLYNPIILGYIGKDESINCLVSTIKGFDVFANAGVILNSVSADGTKAELPGFIGIGVDAGLTSPAKIHMKKYVLMDFLRSIDGDTIVPVYEGLDDFENTSSPLVLPLTDKHRTILRKANRNLSNYKNPKYISHLAFVDSKHIPEHLKSSYFDNFGREKKIFKRRYVDLKTGDIYEKNNDTYVKVEPTVTQKGGKQEHEL